MAILARSRSILTDLRDLRSIATSDRPTVLRLGDRRVTSAPAGHSDRAVGTISADRRLYDQRERGRTLSSSKAYDWQMLREERLVVIAPSSTKPETRTPSGSEPLFGRASILVGRLSMVIRQAGIRPLNASSSIRPRHRNHVGPRIGVALLHGQNPPWRKVSLLVFRFPTIIQQRWPYDSLSAFGRQAFRGGRGGARTTEPART